MRVDQIGRKREFQETQNGAQPISTHPPLSNQGHSSVWCIEGTSRTFSQHPSIPHLQLLPGLYKSPAHCNSLLSQHYCASFLSPLRIAWLHALIHACIHSFLSVSFAQEFCQAGLQGGPQLTKCRVRGLLSLQYVDRAP